MQYTKNKCAHCGQSAKYELCWECYKLTQDESLIKNENGRWVENVIKGNEYKFYDKHKRYYLKEDFLNEYEIRFLEYAKLYLPSKFVIVPQVNLQTIIETNCFTRNDELFRNVDFAIFTSNTYTPIMVIELNGQQHYTNQYYIERDKSVKMILEQVNLPLVTIDIKNLKEMSNNELIKEIKSIKQELKYICKIKKLG